MVIKVQLTSQTCGEHHMRPCRQSIFAECLVHDKGSTNGPMRIFQALWEWIYQSTYSAIAQQEHTLLPSHSYHLPPKWEPCFIHLFIFMQMAWAPQKLTQSQDLLHFAFQYRVCLSFLSILQPERQHPKQGCDKIWSLWPPSAGTLAYWTFTQLISLSSC